MPCDKMNQCPVPSENGVGAIFRKRYCENDWQQCARVKVGQECGFEDVPKWLKPNMEEEADDIIARILITG